MRLLGRVSPPKCQLGNLFEPIRIQAGNAWQSAILQCISLGSHPSSSCIAPHITRAISKNYSDRQVISAVGLSTYLRVQSTSTKYQTSPVSCQKSSLTLALWSSFRAVRRPGDVHSRLRHWWILHRSNPSWITYPSPLVAQPVVPQCLVYTTRSHLQGPGCKVNTRLHHLQGAEPDLALK